MAGKRVGLKALTRKLRQGNHTITRVPLLELASDRRVLIENYCSIFQYSAQSVTVRVDFGCITIRGDGLELSQMDCEHLVISGRILSISLARED